MKTSTGMCPEKKVFWKNVFRKLDSQNQRKELVRKFTAKVTVDAAFLNINAFTSIFVFV